MLAVKDGNLSAVVWDFEQPEQKVSNRPFYTKLVPSHSAAPVRLVVKHLTPGAEYRLELRRTGYRRNDPLSEYIDMGRPKDLTPEQLARMRELTADLAETVKVVAVGSDGGAECTFPMSSNDVVLVSLTKLHK
jgi:xylan 1,4-beta-xylosidase